MTVPGCFRRNSPRYGRKRTRLKLANAPAGKELASVWSVWNKTAHVGQKGGGEKNSSAGEKRSPDVFLQWGGSAGCCGFLREESHWVRGENSSSSPVVGEQCQRQRQPASRHDVSREGGSALAPRNAS